MFGKLLAGIGLLGAGYVGIGLLVVAIFAASMFEQELPRHWKELWREKTEAEVVEIYEHCLFKETWVEQSRKQQRNFGAPCAQFQDKADLTDGSLTTRVRARRVKVRFTATGGNEVIAAIPEYGVKSRGSGPVAPGIKIRISYDAADPERSARPVLNQKPFWSSLAVFIALIAAVVTGAWCFMRWTATALLKLLTRIGLALTGRTRPGDRGLL